MRKPLQKRSGKQPDVDLHPGQPEMLSHPLQYRVQRPDPNVPVQRYGQAVPATKLGRQPDVATHLPRYRVAELTQGLDQLGSLDISGQLHGLMTSSLPVFENLSLMVSGWSHSSQ